jgi:uncharacterized membrane protein YhaH (DUF805 family)
VIVLALAAVLVVVPVVGLQARRVRAARRPVVDPSFRRFLDALDPRGGAS